MTFDTLIRKETKIEILRERYEVDWKQQPVLVDRKIIYPQAQFSDSNHEKVNSARRYTRTLIYKYCECGDWCYSSFSDEKGNEYNFGDLTDVSKYKFQCYANNSDGTVYDPLKERKFSVEIEEMVNSAPTNEDGPGELKYKIISIELIN